MKAFIAIFIFSIVLFIYLHITHHLYVSNDLEVYNLEGASKDKLEVLIRLLMLTNDVPQRDIDEN